MSITKDKAASVAAETYGLPATRLLLEDVSSGWIVSVNENPEAYSDGLIGSAKLFIASEDGSTKLFPSWPNALIKRELGLPYEHGDAPAPEGVAKKPVVCVINCGSNSTKVLIRDKERVFLRTTTVTKLSEAVETTGVLSKDAIARTVAVLTSAREACITFGVTEGRLIATSALRDAKNADEFLDVASKACGLTALVITGDQEAGYAFTASTRGTSSTTALVIDIGGSSTELAKENSLVGLDTASLQLGCVRLKEKALGEGPVTSERETVANHMISDSIDQARAANYWLTDPALHELHAIVIGGTAECLTSMQSARELRLKNPHASLDVLSLSGKKFSAAKVRFWRDALLALSPAELSQVPGLVLGREDTIVAGLFILDALLQTFAVTEVTYQESSIVDAIAEELLEDLN